jgi:hypothetical protein
MIVDNLGARPHRLWITGIASYASVGHHPRMSTTTRSTAQQPARCDGTDRFGYGTECAREAGHSGAHWLTGPKSAQRSWELRLERRAS